ncbi:hypothetical protein [Brevibacillus choshinensis]|uniref:Uncharacterized protein n=1 Tax=Brevibacillus choshinensis TaxID=54911 RepID=A0ABX7FJ11_BRECH|nr:hypothetical protein [Brevibacillus choshinensis]QRG65316.1 hypothetical protein JNE38_16925 [Brevibacillus choshinensis]
MKDYEQQMERIQQLIAELSEQLSQLEQEQLAYNQQRKRRQSYLSSREILELLEERQGRNGSMATIKRWADNGFLGDVVDEREQFPLLESKQGNKRFLYPRDAVLRFLHEKGLLCPAFDILDRVLLASPSGRFGALVTCVEREDVHFRYQVQLEETGEVVEGVPEEDLILP